MPERSHDRRLRPIILQRRVDLEALGSILQDVPNISSNMVGETQSTLPDAGLGLFA